MSHAQAGAWWSDVEHLREAAERRIAERESAQREGREPVALTPLRPMRDAERHRTETAHPTGRFRRHSPMPVARSRGPVATATALATALELDLAPEPEPVLAPEPTPAEAEPQRPTRREEL